MGEISELNTFLHTKSIELQGVILPETKYRVFSHA